MMERIWFLELLYHALAMAGMALSKLAYLNNSHLTLTKES